MAALVLSFSLVSCSKDEETLPPKEELIVGQWQIHTVQQKVYSGSTLVKDTIFPRKTTNVAVFGENGGSFEFKFNTPASETGSYTWKDADSLIGSVTGKTYRWKMLTITRELLTTSNKNTNDPNYPGATVNTYYTFIR